MLQFKHIKLNFEHKMTKFIWNSEQEKAEEWAFAKSQLLVDGKLKPNGTKLHSNNKIKKLNHPFIVIDNQIVAISPKGDYLGKGLYGKAKLAVNEKGELIALKSTLHCYMNKYEAEQAQDLGIGGEDTLAITSKHPNKNYLAYKYLGTPLNQYLAVKKELSLDQRFELSIKIALALDGLHSGYQSKSSKKYLHNDIHQANVVIDEQNEPHFIDFGKSGELEKSFNKKDLDLYKMLLLFYLPEDKRGDGNSQWIFGNFMGEYRFLPYKDIRDGRENLREDTINLHLDPSDKREDGTYSAVRYRVYRFGIHKEGKASLDGTNISIAMPKEFKNEQYWISSGEWNVFNNRDALYELVTLRASENGDIPNVKELHPALKSFLFEPNEHEESLPNPSALKIAGVLSIFRLKFECLGLDKILPQFEDREVLRILNALSPQILSLYTLLDTLSKDEDEFPVLKKYILSKIIHDFDTEQNSASYKEYLQSLPNDIASKIEKSIKDMHMEMESLISIRKELTSKLQQSATLNVLKQEKEEQVLEGDTKEPKLEAEKPDKQTEKENLKLKETELNDLGPSNQDEILKVKQVDTVKTKSGTDEPLEQNNKNTIVPEPQINLQETFFTEEEIIQCNMITSKLLKLSKNYSEEMSHSKSKELGNIVSQLISRLTTENIESPKKVQNFYEFLDSKASKESPLTNLDLIKKDKSISGLKFAAGVIAILISIPTFPIAIPIIGLIYFKTGKNLFDLFKPQNEQLKKEIEQYREKSLLKGFFTNTTKEAEPNPQPSVTPKLNS